MSLNIYPEYVSHVPLMQRANYAQDSIYRQHKKKKRYNFLTQQTAFYQRKIVLPCHTIWNSTHHTRNLCLRFPGRLTLLKTAPHQHFRPYTDAHDLNETCCHPTAHREGSMERKYVTRRSLSPADGIRCEILSYLCRFTLPRTCT